MTRIAACAAALGLVLASSACQKTYRAQAPASLPEKFAKEISARALHEGDNLLVDLETHRLFGEIHGGELQRLRLEVQDEKPDELLLGSLARANPAPPPGEETPMSCEQKEDLCYSHCRRTVSGPDIDCCFLRCAFDRLKCDLGWHPPGWGGGFTLH